MSFNNYKDYIDLLRSREARPSFEQTKAIIESRENESAAYFGQGSQMRNLAIGIAVLVLIAVIGRAVVSDSPKANLVSKDAIVSSQVAQNVHSTSSTSLGVVRRNVLLPMTKATKTTGATSTTNNSSKDTSATEESTSVPLVTSVTPLPITIECAPQNDIPFTLSQIALPTTDEQSKNRFFVTLTGSLSQEMNPIATNNRSSFDAFFGGGYIISTHLSIGLIGGRETFVMKLPNNSTIFTDTNFVHNGIVYPSIIGHVVTNYTPQSAWIYSIGANLRYTFIESSLSPFLEILGSGSTEGAIAGGMIGASIFRFEDFSIDAGAFLRALIPTTGSALTKLGASAQLRYDR